MDIKKVFAYGSGVKNQYPLTFALHRCRKFLLLFAQMGYSRSAACECGAEVQNIDHDVFQCPIHRPPHGLHGLTVLDDETIDWLLNTCPKI